MVENQNGICAGRVCCDQGGGWLCRLRSSVRVLGLAWLCRSGYEFFGMVRDSEAGPLRSGPDGIRAGASRAASAVIVKTWRRRTAVGGAGQAEQAAVLTVKSQVKLASRARIAGNRAVLRSDGVVAFRRVFCPSCGKTAQKGLKLKITAWWQIGRVWRRARRQRKKPALWRAVVDQSAKYFSSLRRIPLAVRQAQNWQVPSNCLSSPRFRS